jgi:predicted ArsR family transcriptional regulator
MAARESKETAMASARTTSAALQHALDQLTRALGDTTRREIFFWAREHGTVTAPEVATRFGLHPNVARHHLDRLVEAGYLSLEPHRERSHVGRPSKRYRAAREGTLLDGIEGHTDLLAALVGRLLDEVPAERAESIAYEIGRAHGAALAAADGTRAPLVASDGVRVVAEALRRSGFAPEQTGASVLRQDGCPFGDLVGQHPVLCATERGILDGLLEALGAPSLGAQAVKREVGSCEVRIGLPRRRVETPTA